MSTSRETKTLNEPSNSRIKILLLTNRDSDNLGDQIIEATDISLIKTAMGNLGYGERSFTIESRAAAIVSKAYMETRDPKLLESAREAISSCDVVLFGGAPLFNYAYQSFYERTAITVELAAEYGKPVFFSGIGVEGYSETNPKCQRLKKALLGGNVKQITTRDGFENLQGYTEGSDIAIGKVSDPAVFTAEIFRQVKPNMAERLKRKLVTEYRKVSLRKLRKQSGKKTIGIFVLRANGFKDNGADFSREDAAQLWLDLIAELESRGYDYELLTSGHFGDEAFLDYMIRTHGVPASKCVFNMNCPEALVKQISFYDGVVSTRLHPNIVSFSLQVPTVGVIWNSKVSRFYDSIGYPNRYLHVDGITAKAVADRLEQAMAEGVERNPDYMMTVYTTMMEGLRRSLCPDNTAQPYGFDELCSKLVPFEGTNQRQLQAKLERKFRRTYGKYNELWDKQHGAGSDKKVPVYFYTRCGKGEELKVAYDEVKGNLFTFKSGSSEIKSTNVFAEEGNVFPAHCYAREGKALVGWAVRVKIGGLWHWHMADGSIALAGKSEEDEFAAKKAVFSPGEQIPLTQVKNISSMVAEAVWE